MCCLLVRCSLVPVAAARAGTRWVPLLLPACCSLSPAAVAGWLRAARCLLAAAHCRCPLLPAATCRCCSLLLKIPRVTSGGPVLRFGMMSVCDS